MSWLAGKARSSTNDWRRYFFGHGDPIGRRIRLTPENAPLVLSIKGKSYRGLLVRASSVSKETTAYASELTEALVMTGGAVSR
jgi:hypothetical protein